MAQSNEGGFVLVEAIAALGMAAIAATALMAALGAASARSDEAHVRSLALRQAQALMAEALHTPDDDTLEHRGELAPLHLTWTRNIDAAGAAYPSVHRVVVEVTWTSLQKRGVTHLEAYRIAPP